MPKRTEIRKPTKLKTLDIVLLGLGTFVILFIISMEVMYYICGSLPDSLVYATLGSGTSEAILTCIITCIKKKANIKDEDID